LKTATRKVISTVVSFLTYYVLGVTGLWGILKVVVYFADDSLKKTLGPRWPWFIFGLPVVFAVLKLLHERYVATPKEIAQPETEKTAANTEPANVYTALDDFLLDFNHDLAMADELVGREEVFAALEKFQAANNCGYFRITAASGLGKSTLAAGVAHKFNAPSFFCNSNRGIVRPDQCLNHLAVSLIKRFSLPYYHLPHRAGENSSFFETILRGAAEKSAGNPVWIVVDGLDEADEAVVGPNTLLLPGHLPEGIFIFVTQRPGNYPLRTQPDTPLEGYEILWDSDSQQNDVSKFLEQCFQSAKMNETLAKLGPEFDRKALISFLEKASEGNFMYLSFVLSDIEAGNLPLSGSANTFQISIPTRLQGYYENTWSQMRKQVGAQGTDEWRSTYRPVIGLLAVAREPVTIQWLADLSGVNVDDVHDQVLRDWQRFLGHEQRDRREYWRILHRSFADFLDEELNLATIHKTVADYYCRRDNSENADGYASRHLSTHLRLAGALKELFTLVDDPGWYERQMITDPTGMSYENDLLVAWAAASADNLSMVQRQQPAVWLAQEIRYALAITSLNGFWRTVRSSVLIALLKAKVLTDEQALAFATNNPNETGRALLLKNLAPVLDEEHVDAAIKSVETIQGPDKIDPLIAFAQRVDASQGRMLLANALEIANEMPDIDSVKPEKLIALAQQFSDPQRQKLLDKAIELNQSSDEDEDKVATLIDILDLLPQSDELGRLTLDAIRKMDDPQQATERMVSLIPFLAAERRHELIQEALTSADKVLDEGSRTRLLASMIPLTTGAERASILDRARAAASAVTDATDKVASLLSIIDVVENSLEDSLLREAEDAAHQIDDDTDRALKLVSIATHYFSQANESQDPTRVARGEEIVEEATTIVRGFVDPLTKARALISLAVELPDDRLIPLVQEAARIPGSILVLGGLKLDHVEQVELIASIACRVSSPHKEELVQRAIAIAETIERMYDRGHAFTCLLPCLEPESRAQLANELVSMTSELDSPAECAEMLTAALPCFTEPERHPLFERAAKAARAVEPGALSITGTVQMETLVVDFERFPENLGETSKALLAVARTSNGPEAVALINEAFDFVYEMPAGNSQSSSLKQLAPYLSRDQVVKAITDYRLVHNDPERQLCLEKVVDDLNSMTDVHATPPDNLSAENDAALDATEDDPDTSTKFEIDIPQEIFRLNRSPNQLAFDIRFTDSEGKHVDEKQELRLSVIANVLNEVDVEALEEIRDNARDFNYGWRWRQALAELFNRLAATDSVEVVLESAKAIWPEQLPPEVVSFLSPKLPVDDSAAMLASAMEATREMDDSEGKAMAFSYLIPRVDEPKRSQARRGMIAALEQNLKSKGEPRVFIDLVSNLPTLPTPTEFYPLAQLVLRLTSTRESLLQYLRKVLPFMCGVSPPGTDASIAATVLEVCDKWK